jgi:hypothetical protein
MVAFQQIIINKLIDYYRNKIYLRFYPACIEINRSDFLIVKIFHKKIINLEMTIQSLLVTPFELCKII